MNVECVRSWKQMKCGPGNYLHHYLHTHWDFPQPRSLSLSLPPSVTIRVTASLDFIYEKWKPHIRIAYFWTQCSFMWIPFANMCSPTVHACAHECAQTQLQSLMNAEKVIIQSQEHIFDNNNNWVLFATMPAKYNFITLHNRLHIHTIYTCTIIVKKTYHKFLFKPNSMHYLVDIGHMRTVNFMPCTRTSHTRHTFARLYSHAINVLNCLHSIQTHIAKWVKLFVVWSLSVFQFHWWRHWCVYVLKAAVQEIAIRNSICVS